MVEANISAVDTRERKRIDVLDRDVDSGHS